MAWADTCSKPRIGEFSGGAAFVTADKIEYIMADEWHREEQAFASGSQAGGGLADRAARNGRSPARHGYVRDLHVRFRPEMDRGPPQRRPWMASAANLRRRRPRPGVHLRGRRAHLDRVVISCQDRNCGQIETGLSAWRAVGAPSRRRRRRNALEA